MNTILESHEWNVVMARESEIGAADLLEEILESRTWSNSEMLWVIRRFIFHYALHDPTLKKVPTNKVFDNFVSMMRAFYMAFDQANPDLDVNIRTYMTTKMNEATWGLSAGTRMYLDKIES